MVVVVELVEVVDEELVLLVVELYVDKVDRVELDVELEVDVDELVLVVDCVLIVLTVLRVLAVLELLEVELLVEVVVELVHPGGLVVAVV